MRKAGAVKFIHASDIHLDSPLRGLERYEGAPVEEAIAEEVSFVLIAGDLYDGDWKDYSTGLFLVGQLARLREAGIRALIIAGNHDAASQITRQLRLPENTTLFASGEPQTVVLEDCGVAVHGQSFATPAVTDNLAVGYPAARSGYLNIGLLHTCLTGSEGHENYAPCNLAELSSRGYDYWALGHVHKRQVVCEDPWVVFAGNIQGRHARELGPKGCTLVTVEGGGVARVEERHLDVMRWALCPLDIGEASGGYDAVDLAKQALAALLPEAGGRSLAVRFLVGGAGPARAELLAAPERWANEMRAAVMEESGEQAWVEKVKLLPGGAGEARGALEEGGLPASVARSMGEMALDEGSREELDESLEQLMGRLPAELWELEAAPDLDDEETMRALLEDARQIALERLVRGGDGA